MDNPNACGRRAVVLGALAVAAALPDRASADIPRLAKIRRRIEPQLHTQYAAAGLSYPPKRLLLRVFKHERQVELWVADAPKTRLTKLETFEICAASGVLGPKLRQGDEQVPEGVYAIHRYNGWSGFHLSLRVNYPNASDRVRGRRGNLGGAIMVHGGCASIGCVAISNGPIERVFLAALDSSRAGHRKPTIHMFPTRFDDAGRARQREYLTTVDEGERKRLEVLWSELAAVDAAFAANEQIPAVRIDAKTGEYTLVPSESATTGEM